MKTTPLALALTLMFAAPLVLAQSNYAPENTGASGYWGPSGYVSRTDRTSDTRRSDRNRRGDDWEDEAPAPPPGRRGGADNGDDNNGTASTSSAPASYGNSGSYGYSGNGSSNGGSGQSRQGNAYGSNANGDRYEGQRDAYRRPPPRPEFARQGDRADGQSDRRPPPWDREERRAYGGGGERGERGERGEWRERERNGQDRRPGASDMARERGPNERQGGPIGDGLARDQRGDRANRPPNGNTQSGAPPGQSSSHPSSQWWPRQRRPGK